MQNRRGQKLRISNLSGDFCLYPSNVYSQLKVNDILNIGFSNLNLKVINFTFRDLAKERDISFSELHALASKDSSIDKYLDQNAFWYLTRRRRGRRPVGY